MKDTMETNLPSEETGKVENENATLETAENEMGLIRLYGRSEEYVLTLASHSGDVCHILQTDKAFTRLKAFIRMNRTEAGQALSSLLRIAYSQAILYHDAVAVHASAVYYDGHAYLFMGKSGTGKSTHASLWMKHISGTASVPTVHRGVERPPVTSLCHSPLEALSACNRPPTTDFTAGNA